MTVLIAEMHSELQVLFPLSSLPKFPSSSQSKERSYINETHFVDFDHQIVIARVEPYSVYSLIPLCGPDSGTGILAKKYIKFIYVLSFTAALDVLSKLHLPTAPPPLNEGESLVSRILQLGPPGTKFLG